MPYIKGVIVLRIEELKKSFAEKVYPVYLIEGEDAYFRELAVKNLKDKFLSAPDLNFSVFEGGFVKGNPSEMIETLMQYPFMSEKRLVLVRDYYPTATDLKNKALADYLKNPVETSMLVIVNSTSCETLKKFENVCVVDCGKSDINVLIKYVQVTLKRNNLIITSQNAKLLCEYCKAEMTKISGEVEKLAAYCYGEAEVTQEAIEELTTKETDFQIYEMTENVANKRYDKAYEILDDILSKSADYQRLFSSLYFHFRRLFFCSVSDKSVGVLAKQLGVKEYAVKKSIEQAKRFSAKRLKQIVDMFEDYDAQFKSGKISIQSALTLSVGKIMS